MKKTFLLLFMVLLTSCGGAAKFSQDEAFSVTATAPENVSPDLLVGTAWIEVLGEPLPDGGWIPTEVLLKDESENILGNLVVHQDQLTFGNKSSSSTYSVETNTTQMTNMSYIEIVFNLGDIPMPGGTLYCYMDKIYWYPPGINPSWFNTLSDLNG